MECNGSCGYESEDRERWRDLISGPISHPEKELRRKRRRYKNSTAAKITKLIWFFQTTSGNSIKEFTYSECLEWNLARESVNISIFITFSLRKVRGNMTR